jgi:hypothetical protein
LDLTFSHLWPILTLVIKIPERGFFITQNE